ncbi:MAG: DUF4174 domain-containing protein [Pseudomonadota bacterium]
MALFFGVFLSSVAASDSFPVLRNLSDLEWDNRIILIDGSHLNADKSSLINALQDADFEILDRHIFWFVFEPLTVVSNYPTDIADEFVSKTYRDYFQNGELAVLIGKDGTVKATQQRLRLNDLFALIDMMPMRRFEMQESQQ